jgi:HD-like signal output (HDOD) protein
VSRLKVLFVDDEQRVLDGIRRMLYDMRGEWEMEFLADPRAAVAAVARTRYDVVVSDMRMPEIDGAELMMRVRESCPGSVRIILSGHSDSGAAIRAAGTTHQFLAKPCDPGALRAAISSVQRLRHFVRRDALVALVNRIDTLPKLPLLCVRLLEELKDPDVTTDQLAATLGSDPGLCAEVMKLANSAFFRVSTPVDAIDRAVRMIGVSNLTGLAIASAVRPSFRSPEVPPEVFEELWAYSIKVARIAGAIGRSADRSQEQRGPAATAALLHDVGRLVLIAHQWSDYVEVRDRVARGERRAAVEEALFGVTSAEVGGYLLGLWNLPDNVVNAVANHMEPGRLAGAPSPTTAVVHLSALLATETEGGAAAEASADLDYLVGAGIEPNWDGWRRLAAEATEELRR